MCDGTNSVSLVLENETVYIDRCCGRRHGIHLFSIPVSEFEKIDDIVSYLNKFDFIDFDSDFPTKSPLFICNDEKVCPSIRQIKKLNVDLFTFCNINCSFCCVQNFRTTASFQRKLYFGTLNKLKGKVDVLRMTQAGEPLFYLKDVKSFLKNLKEGDFEKIEITTNGTLIDDEFCEIVNEVRNQKHINIHIVISINSARAKTRKALMRVDDFEKVKHYIFKLNAYASAIAHLISDEELKEFKEMFSPNIVIIP